MLRIATLVPKLVAEKSKFSPNDAPGARLDGVDEALVRTKRWLSPVRDPPSYALLNADGPSVKLASPVLVRVNVCVLLGDELYTALNTIHELLRLNAAESS